MMLKIAGEVATLTDPALDRILDFAGEVGLVVILHNDINMPFPKSAESQIAVYRMWEPVFKLLEPEAKSKVLKGNYERLFDEARAKVRAWLVEAPRAPCRATKRALKTIEEHRLTNDDLRSVARNRNWKLETQNSNSPTIPHPDFAHYKILVAFLM